jgi:hypothetical protein
MFGVDRARELGLDKPPLVGRADFLPTSDRSVIQAIRCGILFVMAFWSGTSYRSLTQLKQALAKLDPKGRLEVVVVDTDGCPDLYDSPELLGKLHGNGEAAWIIRGRVVATAACGSHPRAFETYTQHLLAECAVTMQPPESASPS